ncbi:MAG: hypothetical protein JO164_07645 [Candidatus Eremiobacteraeota bacterium]|nr:hypothetical protein [Candidatus Eremiobacteraeota bacterium]
MSVQPTSYPGSDALSIAASNGASGSSSSSNASGSSSTQSSYQKAYDNLVAYDDQELLQVSLGSPSAAQANVSSVLQQAAQQLSALQPTGTTNGGVTVSAPSVPTIETVIGQSENDAGTALANWSSDPLGTNVNTTA